MSDEFIKSILFRMEEDTKQIQKLIVSLQEVPEGKIIMSNITYWAKDIQQAVLSLQEHLDNGSPHTEVR